MPIPTWLQVDSNRRRYLLSWSIRAGHFNGEHEVCTFVSPEWPIGHGVAKSNEMWPFCLRTYNYLAMLANRDKCS